MTHRLAQGTEKHVDRQMIAILNDGLREHLTAPGRNRVVMTQGIAALIGDVSCYAGFHRPAALLRIIRDYRDFSPDNDPYGEHDLGLLEFEADASGRSIITIQRWWPGPRTRRTPL